VRFATAGQKHKVAGLFAGIGGIELGLHLAGHQTTLLCDNDPAAMAVLKAQFPSTESRPIEYHDDVTGLSELPEGTSLITAGFPCQDLSQAGDRPRSAFCRTSDAVRTQITRGLPANMPRVMPRVNSRTAQDDVS